MGIKKRIFNRTVRRLRRAVKRITKPSKQRAFRRYAFLTGVAMLIATVLFMGREVPNVNYATLLNTIAAGESKGNYNAYFGHAQNMAIDFTAMTVGEVLEWQRQYVEQGSPSNAVGRYQFIRPTLAGLVNELRIGHDARFDAALQDRLAIRLIERRGVYDYIHGRISREQLAHNLSKEWAALPRVLGDNPAASYYEGDGLNRAHLSIEEVFAAIDSLRAVV